MTKLQRLHIYSPTDLLFHFPYRYVDFSHSVAINQIEVGTNVTITGQITRFQNIFTRSHKNIQKATVSDKSGSVGLIWFNQPYLSHSLIVGSTLSFAGEVSLFQNQRTIIAPIFGSHHTGKIIAIYPQTQGLTSSWFRQAIQSNLASLTQDIIEILPPPFIKKYRLLPLSSALTQIHDPQSSLLLESARNRLALQEIISLQATSYLQKQTLLQKQPFKIFKSCPQTKTFVKSLPFKLTASQISAWQQIESDLLRSIPMNRLLQGQSYREIEK